MCGLTDNAYYGETLSFIDLLEKNKVEIPIIQRDYAQGRIEHTSIRLAFLNALRESIVDRRDIKLDFVYGNILNGAFQPLDGQQRLTTLFLLHWYAAVRCEVIDDVKKLLSRFSYETRISSREFCEDLINKPIVISESTSKPSDEIINSNWFFLSWKQDPTVRAMLSTIDDIHNSFYEIKDLWEILVSEKRITFHYLILKDFGLSDDLYIKMNARGRLLTPFENFKASLQKLVNDKRWEQDMPFPVTFAAKIDTRWADYFWNKYRDKNDSIDTSQMKFITAIIMNCMALDKAALGKDDRLQTLQRLNENNKDIRLLSYITVEVFKYLYNCYECYSNLQSKGIDLSLNMAMWRHKPRESILSEIANGDGLMYEQRSSSSYTHKVLFFAQTEYLLRNECFNTNAFSEWMRVVRNVISRGSVDSAGKRPDLVRSPQTFYGIINLINELAEGSSNIYDFLRTCKLSSSFAKEQIDEEQRKAKIICERPELKDLIWMTEDNELLRGRISFVFDCIGYKNDPSEIDEKLLSQVQNVFETYFNNENELSDLFRRAMLTIEVDGKYECYNYWWSLWSVAVQTTKRKLFLQFRELEFYIYNSEQRDYFKKLVLALIEKNYTEIIKDFEPPVDMPNWKIRLIKEDDLLKKQCASCYIAISDENDYCYLLKSQRPRELAGNTKIE